MVSHSCLTFLIMSLGSVDKLFIVQDYDLGTQLIDYGSVGLSVCILTKVLGFDHFKVEEMPTTVWLLAFSPNLDSGVCASMLNSNLGSDVGGTEESKIR